MNINTQKINDEIKSLKAQNADKYYTDAEIKKYDVIYNEWLQGDVLDDITPDYEKAIDIKGYLLNIAMIKMLEQTLNSDLMACPKRYVITDTKALNSPAGFHPSERIYTQTTIAIHTDSLDIKLPSCNRGLYAHDIDAVANR